jgi:hypothetical protein
MELINNINKILEDAEKYTAHNGKLCYRTFGNLDYYFFMCQRFNIEPKAINSGLTYEAKNKYIEFDYCEHDIILHIKKIFVKTPFSGWHEVSKEQAKIWAKHLYNGANHKNNAIEIIKKNILGIEFDKLGVV